ncbi:MAG TPA: YggT family protein [Steroidobacteraceae bacterium]|nr:YggT family protein [Steroidobacteraceae bacterium]
MNDALYFVLNTLLTLVVVVFLLRVLMPLVRADFRNPVGEAVLKITNPLVLPLRRVFRPGRRVDVASIVALLIVQFAKTIVLLLVRGAALRPDTVLVAGLFGLVILVIQFYFYAVLIYAIMSWFGGASYSPVGLVLGRLVEPLLAPFRRVIPPIGGLDLSALFLMIALQAVLILLRSP